jgi:DNA-binding CsgD family transcriptional regulator
VVHAYFACYSILAVLAAIAQTALGVLWKLTGEKRDKALFFFWLCIFADVVIGYSYFYLLPNVISLNPLAQGIGMQIYNRSPLYFALLTVQVALAPFLFYFLFTLLAEVSGRYRGTNAMLGVCALVSVWFFLSNWSVPTLLQSKASWIQAICFVNEYAMVAIQALAVLAIAIFWRHAKKGAGDVASHLADGLIGSMVFLVALSLTRTLFLWAYGEHLHGVWANLLMFATNRQFALCLSALIPVGAYARRSIGLLVGRANNQRPIPHAVFEGLAEKYGLTPRELEIAELVAAGLANKDISARLGISYNTVKNHVASLFSKLGIRSRLELISIIYGSPLEPSAH